MVPKYLSLVVVLVLPLLVKWVLFVSADHESIYNLSASARKETTHTHTERWAEHMDTIQFPLE